jgi:hypothetical protein
MVACSLRTAFDTADGEHIDVARRDLKNVSAVIEKFRSTAIERDLASRVTVARLAMRRRDFLE